MILENNNLQTVQERTKSYIEVIALYVHSKNQESSSITFKSHKLALDCSRLCLEHKLLENKWGRIFLRSTSFRSFLYKIFLTNLGRVNQPFILYLRWNSTMRSFFYHKDLGQNTVFHNFEIEFHSFNTQDDQSTRGLLAKPLKKLQDHLYGQPVASCGVFEWTLIELRFNTFIFYLVVL